MLISTEEKKKKKEEANTVQFIILQITLIHFR